MPTLQPHYRSLCLLTRQRVFRPQTYRMLKPPWQLLPPPASSSSSSQRASSAEPPSMVIRIGPGPPPCRASTIPLSLFFFLLLVLCSSFPCPVASQGAASAAGVDAERRALLRMKAAWGNPHSLSSWTSSPSSPPCGGGWNGITCGDDGSVTGIVLVDQGIDGEFPAVTCDLLNLDSLNLYNNTVGGFFPTVLYNCSKLRSLNLSQNLFTGELPGDVDRLSKLEILDLSGNNFSGNVPAALGRIPRLRQLRLDNNLFDGTFPGQQLGALAGLEDLSLAHNPFEPMALPAVFGNLRRLQYLWVSDANLIGEIPESLHNLTNLEYLDLSTNELEGVIPGRIWQLEKLQTVYLYHNRLSGRIAAGTVAASGLRHIDLSMNALSGPIPEEFGKQPNLTGLFLYKNQLSGQIPDGLAGIPTLRDIRLFDNNLSGVLPPELGKNSKLLNLEVSGNRLSGELPGDLCAGGILNTVVVFNNDLTGSLPKSLGDCKSLRNLQVHGNGFSGDIPAGVWSLPILEVVIMHGNSLSGEMPGTLPPSLSRMEIENNRFSGRVPSSARSLKVFRGSNNMFSGEIPADLTGMAQLLELSLDGNQISGGIPEGMEVLRWLATLNLSANHLSGAIPAAMGSLPVLTSLDLSGNRLTGDIPTSMGGLKLNFLNLSSNSLTGQIPAGLQIQAFDRSFLSNAGLCSPNSILSLPTCGRAKSGNSDGLSKGMITLFWVLGALFFLAALLLAVFVVRDIRRRKYGYDLSSWKLTSFQSLDFAEANIIRGLTTENLVGSGGSGQVYRVPLGNRTGEVVAVKKIWNSKKLDSKLGKEFEAEVKILGSIRHANIVKLLCCISSSDYELLVYEYMENGSLDHWLHGKRRGSLMAGGSAAEDAVLDWPARLSIAVGAAQGLCYMHQDCIPAIVHRDVKSSNILLDADLKPKVADFGLARMLVKSGDPETVSAVAGSFGYMAPECAYSRKVNEKVDVYSFGVVLLELTTGRRANDGGNEQSSLADWAWRHFQEGRPMAEALDERIRDPLFLEEMSVVLRLGVICTGSLPSTRPTMKDVLQVLLRCAQTHGELDKAVQEYDAAPLLRDARKKNSWRKRPSYDADDGDDEESGLAYNV